MRQASADNKTKDTRITELTTQLDALKVEAKQKSSSESSSSQAEIKTLKTKIKELEGKLQKGLTEASVECVKCESLKTDMKELVKEHDTQRAEIMSEAAGQLEKIQGLTLITTL